ncbi:MAG: MoaD/ThiS family protein, partial [Gammaproteobacteria bacterium]|nr:MoaD/ThiS family protein [Gammaproteobacteria bacterium]
GHDTGIYSWDTLYDLGKNFDKYWQDYLEALEAIGYQRNEDPRGLAEGEKVKIKILYFVQLPDVFGTDSEEVELPDDVKNIEQLLNWLRSRGKQQDDLLKDDIVTVTINKQFAEPFTILEQGDEVAIVPKPN